MTVTRRSFMGVLGAVLVMPVPVLMAKPKEYLVIDLCSERIWNLIVKNMNELDVTVPDVTVLEGDRVALEENEKLEQCRRDLRRAYQEKHKRS